MREILFRAKRLDNGEWAEATSIAKNQRLDDSWIWFIGAAQPAEQYNDERGNIVAAATTGECLFYACDPETIGQYTGLTDKNGKKIFEGDILKFHKFRGEPDWCGAIKYDISMFIIDGEQPVDNGGFEVQLCSIDRKRCEVIGNIHDNPELLKEV